MASEYTQEQLAKWTPDQLAKWTPEQLEDGDRFRRRFQQACGRHQREQLEAARASAEEIAESLGENADVFDRTAAIDFVAVRDPALAQIRLYPKLSAAETARFLHDFAQGIAAGAVKKPRYKVTAIEEGRKDAGQ